MLGVLKVLFTVVSKRNCLMSDGALCTHTYSCNYCMML